MRLSIVTITYNVESSIARTMESVLNQTVPIYEYILIDGLSTDKTNSIIDSYRKCFENRGIKFTHISEKDEGISDAFNKGIQIASGDFIGLINSDDELMLNANELLQKNYDSNVDVLYGNCLWVDVANGIQYERKAKENIKEIRYEMVMIHPSTFVRKTAYERYGLFDVSYKHCMDEELLTRFYEGGAKFKYVNQKFTIFKAGGISDLGIKKTLKEGYRLALSGSDKHYVKATMSYIKKYIRYRFSSFCKKNNLYKMIKKDLKSYKNK